MNIIDFREFDGGAIIEADLCIVGSGPCGMSLARELANQPIRVLVLESGGRTEEPESQGLYAIESTGYPRHIDQSLIRVRILGGSSHIWTGRCAPFAPVDFEKRDWVPHSGWPFGRQELDPFLERAGEILGLGPHCYDEGLWERFGCRPPEPALDDRLLQSEFWQFSKHPGERARSTRFAQRWEDLDAPNISVLLHANLTHIDTNPEGTCFESAQISTLERKSATVRAKALVLCCGAIENARLLLASNRTVATGLGNGRDLVGRYFADHPYCELGLFEPGQAQPLQERFGHYWLHEGERRHVYLHGLSLSPTVQREERLLNCATYLMADPARDAPWLAMRELAASVRGGRFTPDTYRKALRVLRKPRKVLQGLVRRYKEDRPAVVAAERIALGCNIEQIPDPESRVTLSDQKDALGMPISRVHWKIAEAEVATVRRMSRIVQSELRRIGLPAHREAEWLESPDGWRSAFVDVAHHFGTTRMANDPSQGVVDTNGEVHGVANLFVAGGSVFPTPGTANPTLMMVAMTLRLADWLRANRFGSAATPTIGARPVEMLTV